MKKKHRVVLLSLVAMLAISANAFAYGDKDLVSDIPQTGMSGLPANLADLATSPAVHFVLNKDALFKVGSYEVDIMPANALAKCVLGLASTDDTTSERMIAAGKKMTLVLEQYENDSDGSEYMFYLAYPSAADSTKLGWAEITCSMAAKDFSSYSFGQLKNDLREYFTSVPPSATNL